MATHAQIHEVGVFLGGSNYIGDMGPTFISPNDLQLEYYTSGIKSRHSYRFSYTQSKITQMI
jgi:hypothetical protein